MSFTTDFAVVPRKMDSGWGVLLTTHSEQLMDAKRSSKQYEYATKTPVKLRYFSIPKGLYFVEEDASYISNDS